MPPADDPPAEDGAQLSTSCRIDSTAAGAIPWTAARSHRSTDPSKHGGDWDGVQRSPFPMRASCMTGCLKTRKEYGPMAMGSSSPRGQIARCADIGLRLARLFQRKLRYPLQFFFEASLHKMQVATRFGSLVVSRTKHRHAGSGARAGHDCDTPIGQTASCLKHNSCRWRIVSTPRSRVSAGMASPRSWRRTMACRSRARCGGGDNDQSLGIGQAGAAPLASAGISFGGAVSSLVINH